MDLIMVTGFLGAGKTTLLKELVRLFQDKKLYLIINEFGAEGVDGTLLSALDVTLRQINNGSILCSCRLDQFEAALEEAGKAKPDLILVETSGLTDPSGIRTVLDRFPAIRYRGSVCLADAAHLEKVVHTAQMVRKQLAASSLVLLNKTDLASPEQQEAARALIRSIHPLARVESTRYGKISPAWLDALRPAGEENAPISRMDITLQKSALRVSVSMDQAALTSCLRLLSEGAYRMKGFVSLADGVFRVDCTAESIRLFPWEGGADNVIVLLAGKGMPLRKTLKLALNLYSEYLTLLPNHE